MTAFVGMQFDAEYAQYQEHYAGAAFDIILINGQPAGRLYVARKDEEIRIVIALLPEHSNRDRDDDAAQTSVGGCSRGQAATHPRGALQSSIEARWATWVPSDRRSRRLSVHGVVTGLRRDFTDDLDILVRPTLDNAARLLEERPRKVGRLTGFGRSEDAQPRHFRIPSFGGNGAVTKVGLEPFQPPQPRSHLFQLTKAWLTTSLRHGRRRC